MKRAMLSLVLGLLGFGLFVTSVALAASSQPLAARLETSTLFQEPYTNTDTITDTDGITDTDTITDTDGITDTDTITDTDGITDTDTVSPTTTFTHPVASAIAEHFEVDYSEIWDLHEEGLGFGVIARAYFISETIGISATGLLDEFMSGKGWGVIMKEHELHPGMGHGKNLGYIMSGRWRNDSEGGTLSATGQHVPPGQLKKLEKAKGNDRDQGGSSSTPPGKAKDKGNKGKGKGKNK